MGKETGKYVVTSVAGEQLRAFIPDSLPPKISRKESAALSPSVAKAEAALEILNIAGEMIPSIDWFSYAFVRKEALTSSEIEGTQATLTDVFSFEHTEQVGSSTTSDLEEVSNYVSAMNYAIAQLRSESGLPISTRLLDECHKRLMQGVRGENKLPGEIRRSQNWIGGQTVSEATFVPPPPECVRGLLSDLELFIHRNKDLPPLLRIAAAHVQFATIHPYLDGNGRLGRMLISLLLEHFELLSHPLLYMSLYFKEIRFDYYERLNLVRSDGGWYEWFDFFLTGVEQVATDATNSARKLHRQISTDRQRLIERKDVTVSAIKLFEQLPQHPVISMPLVTRLLDTSKPTATKTIDVLCKAGILSEIGAKKRDRNYCYGRYIEVLK